MCGSEVGRLKPVRVEGTQLMLCDGCSRFGVEVVRPPTQRVARPSPRTHPPRRLPEQTEYDLAIDYPDRIRRAREARGWKREDLGRRINEKLSVIEKLEKGRMTPSDQLVSKLERALQVKLREKVEEVTPTRSEGSRPLTLGDLIRRQG